MPGNNRSTAVVITVALTLSACGEDGPGGVPGRGAGPSDLPASAGALPGGAVPAADETAGGVAIETAVGAVSADAPVAVICDTIGNSYRCARAVERLRLPTARRAARRGDTLLLTLATGDTARLADFTGRRDAVIHYSYQDHWPGPGYFVVHKQFYEGSQHVLVDDSSGARTVLAARPVPAPGGVRFAVLSLDLVAGYGPNVLQVWTLDGRTPRREWEATPTEWGPTDGRWVDSSTLRLTQHGYCSELGGSGQGMCDRPATLRKVAGDWRLEEGAPGG